MFSRVPRTIISFVAVLTSYWLYALVAVPLIEPSASAGQMQHSTAADRQAAATRVDRYAKQLAVLFPAGHWALERPTVLKSPYGLLLLKKLPQDSDGPVRLDACVLVLYRDPPTGETLPRDCVVVEAPDGAVLQLDGGFHPAQGLIGKLRHGHVPGQIIIRSDMQQPGPQDDLYMVTRDVEMNERRIWNDYPVKFRLGHSHGSGRSMEIRLLPVQPGNKHDKQLPNIGGIQSFDLASDVQVHMDTSASHAPQDPVAQPPVEITCRGAFHFDMEGYEATFEDQVDVVRLNRQGPSDQIRCELLSILFEPTRDKASAGGNASRPTGDGETNAEEGSRTQGALPSLEPKLIEARGYPVMVTSPSTDSSARCRSLKYDLETGEVTLDNTVPSPLDNQRTADGGQPVESRAEFVQGLNTILAPRIKYRPDQRPGGLGTLSASGPGKISTVPGENAPAAPFAATWQHHLQLRRVDGQQVISLYGRPQLSYGDLGTLAAREFHIFLIEPAAAPTVATPTRAAPIARARVLPDRMKIVDARFINSPWIKGEVGEVQAWFEHAEPAESLIHGDQSSSRGQPVAAGNRQPPAEPLEVRAAVLQMQLTARGQQTDVQKMTLLGSEGAPAHLAGRGMSLDSQIIEYHRQTNRFWCDRPGTIRVPVKKDLRGQPLLVPRPLTIQWQKKMDFDGERMRFFGDVAVHNHDRTQRLRTPLLVATLAEPLDLRRSSSAGQQVQIRELACRDGVEMESHGFDQQGRPTWDRMQTASVQVNLSDRDSGDEFAGNIYAAGPGWLKSTRYGHADQAIPGGATAGPATPGAPAAGGATSTPGTTGAANQQAGTGNSAAAARNAANSQPGKDRLYFLQVDFLREAKGNLHDKQITLFGQTRAVYGPVERMDKELDVDAPESLGEEGMRLESEQLTITDMATGRDEPMALELQAEGNVEVEGRSYLARGNTLGYDHSKGLIVLEGTGNAPAELYRRNAAGRWSDGAKGSKIMYWRATGRVKGIGLQYGEGQF